MTKVEVVFADYARSSKLLERVCVDSRATITSMVSALSGSLAGAGGTDEAGRNWSREFDEAMRQAMSASSQLVNAAGNRSETLHASGLNHIQADAESTAGGGDGSFPPAPVVTKLSAPSVPSADGGEPSVPFSGVAGQVWSMVAGLVGFLWPNGSPEKLRMCAGELTAGAKGIDGAREGVLSAKSLMAAQSSPEIPQVLSKLSDDYEDWGDLSEGFEELADSAREYADHIDTARRELLEMLVEFGLEAAATQVIGSLIPVVGNIAGAAVTAGRLGMVVVKLQAIYRKFKALVDAILVVIRRVAARLGAKLKRLLSRITKRGRRAGKPARGGVKPGTERAVRERPCQRDPVDVTTGEVVLEQVDVDLPGVLPLRLRRTYISSYEYGYSLGGSWSSSLDQRLEVDSRGVVAVGEDGLLLTYPHPGVDGEWVWPVVGGGWLLSIVASRYELCDPIAGIRKVFGVVGKVPASGEDPRVSWLERVVDASENSISFLRDAHDVPVEVVHSCGYRVLVECDDDGLVTGLRLAGASTVGGLTSRDSEVGGFTPRAYGGVDMPGVRLMSFSFDESGALSEVINSSGRGLGFGYDRLGRLRYWLDRNGVRFEYEYDFLGRCVSQASTTGVMQSRFVYEHSADEGGLTRVNDSVGGEVSYYVDADHRVVKVIDELGRTSGTEFTRRGYPVAFSRADGSRVEYERDDFGDVTVAIDPVGQCTRVDYASPGRPGKVVCPDGSVLLCRYDERGLLVARIDTDGAETTFSYDQSGACTQVVDPLGRVTAYENNSAGLPVVRVDPGGIATTFCRDGMGRVIDVTDAAGVSTRLVWNVESQLVARHHASGGVEKWAYDREGNLAEYIDATGAVTCFTYGEFDKPATETDAAGAITRYEWDSELRLVEVMNPAGLRWSYDYDLAGQLVSETDFNGRTTEYTHDLLGRVVSHTSAHTGQGISFNYDGAGWLS